MYVCMCVYVCDSSNTYLVVDSVVFRLAELRSDDLHLRGGQQHPHLLQGALVVSYVCCMCVLSIYTERVVEWWELC